ncbi:unnamed protein product [Cuscuta epithymum]|uniref:Uncharacterized protein n=1 Tax=Cuscuta epithymum TaxID=186058 RepID=A0AAV0FYQ3_9ASTE|nr:unnamed protein product [Cuscuta epithymum]
MERLQNLLAFDNALLPLESYDNGCDDDGDADKRDQNIVRARLGESDHKSHGEGHGKLAMKMKAIKEVGIEKIKWLKCFCDRRYYYNLVEEKFANARRNKFSIWYKDGAI